MASNTGSNKSGNTSKSAATAAVSRPEPYKGADARLVACLREYTVKGGTPAGAAPSDAERAADVVFEAGQTYSVAPRTAAHLCRQVFNMRDQNAEGRMIYVGTAHFFEDVTEAGGSQAGSAANGAAKAAKATKATAASKAA